MAKPRKPRSAPLTVSGVDRLRSELATAPRDGLDDILHRLADISGSLSGLADGLDSGLSPADCAERMRRLSARIDAASSLLGLAATAPSDIERRAEI